MLIEASRLVKMKKQDINLFYGNLFYGNLRGRKNKISTYEITTIYYFRQ